VSRNQQPASQVQSDHPKAGPKSSTGGAGHRAAPDCTSAARERGKGGVPPGATGGFRSERGKPRPQPARRVAGAAPTCGRGRLSGRFTLVRSEIRNSLTAGGWPSRDRAHTGEIVHPEVPGTEPHKIARAPVGAVRPRSLGKAATRSLGDRPSTPARTSKRCQAPPVRSCEERMLCQRSLTPLVPLATIVPAVPDTCSGAWQGRGSPWSDCRLSERKGERPARSQRAFGVMAFRRQESQVPRSAPPPSLRDAPSTTSPAPA
jgi:hypothetical protein